MIPAVSATTGESAGGAFKCSRLSPRTGRKKKKATKPKSLLSVFMMVMRRRISIVNIEIVGRQK